MTTVFGLRHPDVEAVVLAADRQGTGFDRNGSMFKKLSRKLYSGKSGDFCFGVAGNVNETSREFIQNLIEGKYNLTEAIKKGSFPELREINLKNLGNKIPDPQNLTGIILASRFNGNPQLYSCFPLGSVEQRIWTTAGSGDKNITEYMDALRIMNGAKDYLNPPAYKVSIHEVIRVALEGVRRSQSRDIYSHGLDMVICTPEGIRDHFSELGDDFGKKLKRIQRKYKR